ncbi:heme peroxidase, partial [Ramicandelaber brevisporus]
GLHHARARLEKVKQQFPEISYADLWTLAGVVAVQEMGGPIIPWRPGRTDVDPSVGTASCPPDGRLPDAAQGSSHVRDIFYRMGFNDQEIAALIGAHALGRCHTDRSGYDGPWTPAPTYFTNDFYQRLLGEKWVERKWKGPRQFENASDKSLMMLPGDMAFRDDSDFKKYVEIYAKDEGKFFEDFSAAYVKLLELGVPFKPEAKPVEFAKL